MASRLCSPPRLTPLEVAAVGAKLGRVLAVLHARGVLHRDINASNVLIDAHGGVTLLDLGCAELGEKFYDVPAGERRYLTPPEARVAIPDGGIGQLAWSAPEARAGKGWTDRSDVYSMGHLLFRLMTGRPPTRGADPPTSLLALVVTCPEGIATTIEGALRVDPQARPSAAQFAQDLAEGIEGEEEEFARAVAMAAHAGRPPLRLVPAPGAADWTDHPVPDASSEPAMLAALAEPPPPGPTVPRHARTVLTSVAMVAVAVLALAWWGVHRPYSEPAPALNFAAAVQPPSPQNLAIISPAQSALAPVMPTRAPGTMQDALDAATPALKRCSQQVSGLLFVDFTIADGGEVFAVNVPGSEAVKNCVRAATSGLHFEPHPHAETFTKEYTP